jgi:hypothetical protein
MNRYYVSFLLVVALAVSAVLSSCNKDDDDNKGKETLEVSGQIVNHGNWEKVEAYIHDSRGGRVVLGTGDIGANGRFTLKLEKPDDAHLELIVDDFDEDDDVTISDKTAKWIDVGFNVVRGNSRGYLELGHFAETNNGGTGAAVWFIYVDKNVNIAERSNYVEYGGITERYAQEVDARLIKGWNITLNTYMLTTSNTEYIHSSKITVVNSIPSNARWTIDD